MSDVPMPQGLSQEAVAEWVTRIYFGDTTGGADEGDRAIARAVLALLRAKVREAVETTMLGVSVPHKGHLIWDENVDGFVARVMGEKGEDRG